MRPMDHCAGAGSCPAPAMSHASLGSTRYRRCCYRQSRCSSLARTQGVFYMHAPPSAMTQQCRCLAKYGHMPAMVLIQAAQKLWRLVQPFQKLQPGGLKLVKACVSNRDGYQYDAAAAAAMPTDFALSQFYFQIYLISLSSSGRCATTTDSGIKLFTACTSRIPSIRRGCCSMLGRFLASEA